MRTLRIAYSIGRDDIGRPAAGGVRPNDDIDVARAHGMADRFSNDDRSQSSADLLTFDTSTSARVSSRSPLLSLFVS
jgi:hypothetical protein